MDKTHKGVTVKKKNRLPAEVYPNDANVAETNNATPNAQKGVNPGGKMTISEYEQKYTKRQNARGARFLLWMIGSLIGVALFACLFFLTLRVYELNEYAGYVAIGISVVLYILVFVVPIIRISRLRAFETNVNVYTAAKAKRHNKKLRHDIAEKIIDITAKVDGVGWYDSEVVGRMAIALKSGDEEQLKKTMSELYEGSVKKSARVITSRFALKCGWLTALSQDNKLDTAIVVMLNIQMVKDIMFLYGFRPSDARLVKIFATVLQNAIVAYGVGSAAIGGKALSAVFKRVPVLGDIVGTLIDSSVHGLVNSIMAEIIGRQTVRYLVTEYRLQEVLDSVDLTTTDEEFAKDCEELESELKRKKPSATVA